MKPNPRIIQLGEAIHDGLLDFVRRDIIGEHEIYSRDLEGGCAVAAAFLVRAIRNRLGLKAKFAAAETHSWVESEGIIYDPTAIQFNRRFPKVRTIYMEDLTEDDIYSDAETHRISFVNKHWPKGQRPSSFKVVWMGDRAIFTWIGSAKRKKAA